MPRGDRRQEIMLAAEQLFASGRIHEVTLDEVAREAKVGKGTIYRYFADKDDLFFQTVNSGFEELCKLVEERVEEGGDFRTQLLNACHDIIRFFGRRRQLFRLIQSEEARMNLCVGKGRERWMKRRQLLVTAVGQILARGVREGVLRDDFPPDLMAMYLLGMLRTRARDLGDSPPEWQTPEVVVDLFCQGACQRPGMTG